MRKIAVMCLASILALLTVVTAATDAKCGPATTKTYAANDVISTGDWCSTGTLDVSSLVFSPPDSLTVTWTCKSPDGGSDASCTVTKTAAPAAAPAAPPVAPNPAPVAAPASTSLSAPITLAPPKTVLGKDVCVSIVYCDNAPDVENIANKMYESLYQGRWYRFLYGKDTDVGNLFDYGLIFKSNAQQTISDFNSDHTINGKKINDRQVTYCWTKDNTPAVFDEKLTPVDTMLIELWSPECGQLPQICKTYNNKNLFELPKNGDTNQYLFVSQAGNAFFKGAGFYASCGTENPPFIDNTGAPQKSTRQNREKILIAGNSNEALDGAVLDFLQEMKTLKQMSSPNMKYYVGKRTLLSASDEWASTAVVGFKEDIDAVTTDLKLDSGTTNSNGDVQTPIVVSDGAGLGNLASYFLNPGSNKNTFLGVDWLSPDLNGVVKVLTSADIAFKKLACSAPASGAGGAAAAAGAVPGAAAQAAATQVPPDYCKDSTGANYVVKTDLGGNIDELAYQLFVKLNKASPRKIVQASLYGCQKSPTSDTGSYMTKYRTFSKTDDYLVNTSKLFKAENSNPSDAGIPLTGTVYAVKMEDGKYYVGGQSLTCHLYSDKKAGSCAAEVLGGSGVNPSPKSAPSMQEPAHYCTTEAVGGGHGESFLDFGVYWDGYTSSGQGIVDFMSGLSSCSTRGMAIEGGDYFRHKIMADDSIELPACSGVLTDKGARECPYDANAGYFENGAWSTGAKLTFGLFGSTKYCACADVKTTTNWKEIPGKPSGGQNTVASASSNSPSSGDFVFQGISLVPFEMSAGTEFRVVIPKLLYGTTELTSNNGAKVDVTVESASCTVTNSGTRWDAKCKAPAAAGTHKVTVKATYNSKTGTVEQSITVTTVTVAGGPNGATVPIGDRSSPGGAAALPQQTATVAVPPDASRNVAGQLQTAAHSADATAAAALAAGPQPAPACTDECSPEGSTTCDGTAAYKTCAKQGSCLKWSSPTNCPSGQVCSAGKCATSCTNECSPEGTKVCDGQNPAYKTCVKGADSCMRWVIMQCSAGLTCSNGQCVTTCTNECTPSDSRDCKGNAYRICGKYNGDCLKWSAPVDCSSSQTCLNGWCLTPVGIAGQTPVASQQPLAQSLQDYVQGGTAITPAVLQDYMYSQSAASTAQSHAALYSSALATSQAYQSPFVARSDLRVAVSDSTGMPLADAEVFYLDTVLNTPVSGGVTNQLGQLTVPVPTPQNNLYVFVKKTDYKDSQSDREAAYRIVRSRDIGRTLSVTLQKIQKTGN